MRNIRYIVMYVIMVIVFIVLCSSIYKNYQNTVNIIKSEYKAKHELVEESIYNTIRYADTIGQVMEEGLNTKMKDYSMTLIKKYSQEPDILNWDLEELQNRFGNYQIYIINKDLEVVRTTYKKDLGLDFKKYPSFSKLIESRMQGNSFIVDRLDVSTNTGELMKYSYMPTPDHKYLLELSIDIGKIFPISNNLDTFSVANNLTNHYPSVKSISIYKFNENGKGILRISKTKPFYRVVMDDNKVEHIKRALKTNQTQIDNIVSPLVKGAYTSKYIPYLSYQNNGDLSWWNSYVIEIIYEDGVMLKEINQQRNLLYRNISIITMVYFVFVFIIIYLLGKSEYMAYHDYLTNLPNKKLFKECLTKRISDANRNGHKLAVLFLDLNNFKNINDTLGHNIGDRLLQEVAGRLKANLRKHDIISRLGGDEFTVLLTDIDSHDDAIKVALKIINTFKMITNIDGHEIFVETSIGISLYPVDGEVPETLVQKADIAMYYAKKHGLDYMLYAKEIEEK